MKKVFITGGAGYIDSHCAISLAEQGYTPIIIDNFSNSYQGIIKKIEAIINKKKLIYSTKHLL
jgi:UDP-glucose 4-epimerase